MYLNHSERRKRLNNLNGVSRDFKESFMVCKTCNGTGLGGLKLNLFGSVTWDGITYCDDCEGWGKIEWIKFLKLGLKFDNFYNGRKTNQK